MADCHLGTDAEAFSEFGVAELVDVGLAELPSLKSDAGRMSCGGVEAFHREQEHPFLLGRGKELELQRQLHIYTVGGFSSFVKRFLTGGGHSSVA